MARDDLPFRQRAMTAAVKALLHAGLTVYRVEIAGKDGGRIIVDLTPTAASEQASDPEPNPWDRIIEDGIKKKVRQQLP